MRSTHSVNQMTALFGLYKTLKETFLMMEDGDRRIFDQYGLNLSRYYALYHIATKPGISASELGQDMLRDKSNVSRMLRDLELDGLVERRPHETDGRAQRLYLTPKGSSLQTRAAAAHRASVSARLRTVDAGDAAHLTELLTRLNEQLAEALGHPAAAHEPTRNDTA